MAGCCVLDDVIVLHAMHCPDEIRDLAELLAREVTEGVLDLLAALE